ncbi:hypothetical protein REPUB_Repub01dG0108000 [Reevesia pubescens]
MEDKLEGIWQNQKITDEKHDAIDSDAIQGDQTKGNVEASMVGKLFTNNPFNKDAMVSTFLIIWKLAKAVEVSFLEENLFLFKFESVKDKHRILDRAPWSFDKSLLMLMDYDGNLRACDYVFNRVAFWIRLYSVPLKWMNKEFAK